MAAPQYWSADVPISMPQPSGHRSMVPMGGFTITPAGLMPDITEADYARLSVPNFAPANFGMEVVFEDEDLDQLPPATSLEVF